MIQYNMTCRALTLVCLRETQCRKPAVVKDGVDHSDVCQRVCGVADRWSILRGWKVSPSSKFDIMIQLPQPGRKKIHDNIQSRDF